MRHMHSILSDFTRSVINSIIQEQKIIIYLSYNTKSLALDFAKYMHPCYDHHYIMILNMNTSCGLSQMPQNVVTSWRDYDLLNV